MVQMIHRIKEIIVFPEHWSLNRAYLEEVSIHNEVSCSEELKWIIEDIIMADLKNDQSN